MPQRLTCPTAEEPDVTLVAALANHSPNRVGPRRRFRPGVRHSSVTGVPK